MQVTRRRALSKAAAVSGAGVLPPCGVSNQRAAAGEQAAPPSKAPVTVRYAHGWGAGTPELLEVAG